MGNNSNFLLYPLSLIYRLITGIRNLLYNSGILTSSGFTIPVICVGNITVGGTGKTPHTEYLAKILRDEFKVAVLSRGYKRKSRGFREVEVSSISKETGDEPLQLKRRQPGITVAVDRDRVAGIKKITAGFPETQVIILDDAFQHRRVKPGLSILLTDQKRLITNDHLLPYGRLRESPSNRKRADIIVVTKSDPGLDARELGEISESLRTSSGQRIFFTTVTYGDPVPVFPGSISGDYLTVTSCRGMELILITGIANPGELKNYLGNFFTGIRHLNYPDHHFFSERDIEEIQTSWELLKSDQKMIITTEKDAVRLREFTNIAPVLKSVFYYLPIEIAFLSNSKNEFDSLILNYVRKNKANN